MSNWEGEGEVSVSEALIAIVRGRSRAVEASFWEGVDWIALLKRASHNRVLYVVAKELLRGDCQLASRQRADLERIMRAGEEKLESFRHTVKFLDSAFGKEELPFLVVKTFKFFDYVTFDVDVLVPYDQFQAAQNALAKAGCRILPHPRKQGLHQRNCRKDSLLNIDLHRKFFWQGLEHVDLDFIWAAPERRMINGIECLCPSLEADFLLHTKQLVYERYYITLLDFLAIKCAYERGDLDLPAIREQVVKYRWESSYRTLLRSLNQIQTAETVSLPYIYPYHEVWMQLKEIICRHQQLPLFDLAYYHFAWGKYYLSGGKSLPYYQHWFDFETLNDG